MKSNLEILAYEPSRLGMLCLRRRELLSRPGTVVTEITLNHELLASSYHTVSEQALASSAIGMHEGDRLQVLIGGLGLGYTARETLRSSRVAGVVVIELLPEVIRWWETGLIPVSAELREDPRFRLDRGDIYEQLLQGPGAKHDLILIDVDHSPDEQLGTTSGRFYAEEGLRAASEHLTPGGILAVWSYAESSALADALGSVFHEVRVEPVWFHNDLIDETETDWLFLARR